MAKQLKNNIVYSYAVIFFRLVNILPRRLALFIGEALGFLAYFAIKKDRHKTLTNLDRAYGNDLTYRRKKEIARRCFSTFGRSVMEVMRFQKQYHKQIRSNIEVIGEENFREAYDRGRGVVVFTGHVGNFELLAAFCAQSKYKTAVIGRELYDKRLDEILISNRTGMGIVNVRTDDSPRSILRLLGDGYAIGFLIDTDSFRVAGELTPFFGRPARTPIGPTQLGLIARAAFMPMFCISLPGGKYRLIIGEELVPESYDRNRENVYRVTCRMTKVIENFIRTYPEQWIWMHNRWHTRPEADDTEFLNSIGCTIDSG
jgi:KDO2-lipid IV(A) lauroyltransferase